MTIQVICLVCGAALVCVQIGVAVWQEGRREAQRQAAPCNVWEALILFLAANMAALVAGVEPTEDWSLAAPLWVASTLMQLLFSFAGLALARIVAFLTGLAMSGWIFAMAISLELSLR